MDPLTLGLIGGAALLLLRRRPAAPAPAPAPAPTAPTSRPLDLAGAGIITAGAILSKLGGDFGQALTGDAAGRVAGTVNWYQGNVFNAGRVVGREFDRLAGGDGYGATGGIAQVTGGTVATVANAFGALASVGLLSLGAVAYAIGSAISDASRLAYGQAGAQRDWDKKWTQVFGEMFASLQANGLDEKEALAIAYPFTDGYMSMENERRFSEWMARGRGLFGLGTLNDAQHAKWGLDRGYFVGPITAGGSLIGPARWTQKDAGFWAKFDALPPPSNDPAAFDREVPAALGRTILRRPYTHGVIAANVTDYQRWMAEPHGFGVDDARHFEVGQAEGRFIAYAQPSPGLLQYMAVDADGNIRPAVYDYRAASEENKRGRIS